MDSFIQELADQFGSFSDEEFADYGSEIAGLITDEFMRNMPEQVAGIATLELLVGAVKMGCHHGGDLNDKEEALFQKVLKPQIEALGDEKVYAELAKPLEDENIARFASLPGVGERIMKLILCFAFADGTAEADVIEKVRKYFGKTADQSQKGFEADLAAAERGDAAAQMRMGIRYAKGIGVGKNDGEAFRWMEKSAEAGQSEAQFNMAIFYVTGTGTEHDMEKAVEWADRCVEGTPDAAQAVEMIRRASILEKKAEEGDAMAKAEFAAFMDMAKSVF